MKALSIKKYGSPDFLQIREIQQPSPRSEQVLIKVHAVSLNDWDWGLLHSSPFVPNRFMAGLFRPKIILGSDIAGVVEKVGSGVSAFKVGDQVYGDLSGCGFGGFAEYVCAPQDSIRLKSAKMTFEQAAAIPQAGMLALQSVMAAGIDKSGLSVLVNGAGGGVGSIAIQLLKLHNNHVTGVDSGEKLAAMRAWGFDHVIDYSVTDFTQNSQRYDLIIDVKTERSPADYERCLKPNGVYATVGGSLLSLLKIALSGLRINRARNKKLKVIGLHANSELEYFNTLFEADQFKPVVDSNFSFKEKDVREAFSRFGAAAHKGKIVVLI
ncbi:NAD(P)-dependent alcohol dehydrogenase [Aliikangiella marina]|uniref:NAD(P)-dependent alcohol dehydrogenase n=1 Tax=Aliikangiella marina TaxID=1712262 RepID=A0A545TH95_9GAMM|nr:NAD(P)-dependent alcohol dehydrogenase [Aliikangiella marina]TQV76568.1 NAD(P)-dependent alcohol dehydrogenase [Aliikangiella marina]